MRALVRGVAAMVFAVMGGAAAEAGEIMGGLYGHAFLEAHGRENDSFDTQIGYRTDPIEALSLIWKPQVHALLAVNDKYSTHFAAVGLDWKIRLSHHWYFRPGIGLAYTTGKADAPPANAPGLTPAQANARLHVYLTRIDFGDPVLFEPELAFGYKVNPKLSVEFSYVHLSNGQILHQGRNEGLDDGGVRLVYKFH